MIDPIISLAFSIYSNPGAYALLIGSGVSRSAGIKTGWEIVQDLIRKLAILKGVELDGEPEAWYVKEFNEEADYTKLLEAIAKTQSDRQALLRSYFEPTAEEREEGLKTPTKAHKAMAELVLDGYIRVIITTNFDRLIEKAVEDAGLVPTVISTPDAIEGAPPLARSRCTIVKVHGDYLDMRIRNNRAELEHYPDEVNQLLDQVFDEYGLVVCGWSAEWDLGLRAALERCKSQRLTLYWTAKDTLEDAAKQLVELRRGQLVEIDDADAFFTELNEKVMALRDISVQRHPLSAKLAAQTVKRYLSEDRHRIALHDLVMAEANRLFDEMSTTKFSVQGIPFNGDDEYKKRVQRYEVVTETLQSMFVIGCYWESADRNTLWVKALERIANPPGGPVGIGNLLDMRMYPALLLTYSGGIASLAREKYETFVSLLREPKVYALDGPDALALNIVPRRVLDGDAVKSILGQNRRAPVSDYLFSVLREHLRELLPTDAEYERIFDRFEYLFSLIHMDLVDLWPIDPMVGCFGWRGFNSMGERELTSGVYSIAEEVAAAGDGWPLLRTGLFRGEAEYFLSRKALLDDYVFKLNWWF